MATAMDRVRCKHCGNARVFRLFRHGFLQSTIYPLFGYYPWKCKACKESMMLRSRKRSRSKKKEYAK